MLPIVWLETWLVCAARTVPTASSQSGTVVFCATITETLLTVSGGSGSLRGVRCEQPASTPPRTGNQNERDCDRIVPAIHGVTTGD